MLTHSRRSVLKGVTLLTLSLLSPRAVFADGKPPSISEVQKKLDNMYRSKTAIARIEMEIIKPNRTRTMRMKMWSKGQTHSLIVLESPARDKGTATLKVDKNLWNYLPKISRTIRVPPSMMLGSWMGSDFTNDDLVKDASYTDDFDAHWESQHPSPTTWLIRMDAKPGKVGLWKKIEMEIDRSTLLPTTARYFDRKNRVARTMTFEEVRMLGGRMLPTVMRIVPADKKGESTVMRYLDMQFDAPVPDSTFSLTRLKSAH